MVDVSELKMRIQGGQGNRQDLEKEFKQKELLLGRVNELHEMNPMLGHRGCRLGLTYPDVSEMQIEAIFEAACHVSKEGIKVTPEIMIPLVGIAEEFQRAKKQVDDIAERIF